MWDRITRDAAVVAPVQVDEVAGHLRLDEADDHPTLSQLIDAAALSLENYGGFSMESQDFTISLDRFPAWEICIPIGPILSITSIEYTDQDGTPDQVVGSSDYELDPEGGRIRPVQGASWPSTDLVYNAVEIKFKAGYETVPSPLQTAVIILASALFENRIDLDEIPMAVKFMVEPYRRARFGA